MLRTVFLAAALCAVVFVSSAEARHRTSAKNAHVACSDPVMRPCEHVQIGRKYSRIIPVAKNRLHFSVRSMSYQNSDNSITRPSRYIAGRLVCAVNVNAELARRGIRGTGSALAKSFLRWGKASRPVEGAVAVYGRKGGGHVAIVSRVVGDRVWVWNPSSRAHRWREVEYRKRAIAYRVAGW